MARREYFKTSLTGMEDHHLPVVALVGRPNVGKSTLFNRLTRSRRALVDPTPGMTRDRLYGRVERDNGAFRLVDTGGLEVEASRMAAMIRDQTDRAIAEAAVLVFIVDGREVMSASDEEIGLALRQLGKPVIVFVNKLDGGQEHGFDTTVYGFGFETTLPGAAEHGLGIGDLLSAIDDHLTDHWRDMEDRQTVEEPIRLAIIGRPNVGKSSIVNRLLNEERVMVSELAGTTRDPIDSFLDYKDQPFCLVDTAGIRKRGRISGSQESLSVMMAKRQVEHADVIALLVDATDPDTAQDAAIAGIADKAYKPVIVVVNKWDLVPDKHTHTVREFEEKIRRRMKFLESSPFVFVSAVTGQRVSRVLDLCLELHQRASQRVTTGVLNRFVQDLAKTKRMPSHHGRLLKVFYITQVSVRPPTFIAVVNTKESLHFNQERFLINRIREAFELEGVPIKLICKPRQREQS